MNEELRLRIIPFFDYWRKRYQFIAGLDLKQHYDEINVLLWASFDALSTHWSRYIGKDQCRVKGIEKSSRLIFDAFLANYGGDVFQLISLPDVWSRVDRNDQVNKHVVLTNEICIFLSEIGNRKAAQEIHERQLRQISDDCTLNDVLKIILENYSGINSSDLEKWLVKSRYGSLAYKKFRCSYLHEGQPDEGTHSFNLSGSPTGPTYCSGLYTIPFYIGFHPQYMLSVLGTCIEQFQEEALRLEQDPAPER